MMDGMNKSKNNTLQSYFTLIYFFAFNFKIIETQPRKLKNVAIVCGILVFIGMNVFSMDASTKVAESCTSPKEVSHIYPLDFFFCFILSFFQQLLQTRETQFILSTVITTLAPITLFVLIESGRQNVKSGLRFSYLLLLLGQFIGIGVALPIFFYPLLESSIISQRSNSRYNYNRAFGSLFLSIIFLVPCFFLFILPPSSQLFEDFNPFFQFLPLICVLIEFVPSTPKSDKDFQNAKELAKFGYAVCWGFNFYQYASSALPFFLTPFSFNGLNPQSLTLIIDFLGIYLCVFFLAIHEKGFAEGIKLTLLSVMISPGAAFSYYFYQRESLSNPPSKTK